ncbi:MAG: hypothetical protein ACK4SY_01075 [Pyrobaculum sp.]
MSNVDKKILATLALYMLEELAWREKVKLKYWKTFRLVQFWLGEETARKIVEKLAEGRYIKLEGGYVILLKKFKPSKSLNAILRDTYTLLVLQRL